MNGNESIFEFLTDAFVNEGLDAVLLDSLEYIKAKEIVAQARECYEGLKLPEKQTAVVDNLLSAGNACSACYVKIAYQQGVKDCVALLKEIGVL